MNKKFSSILLGIGYILESYSDFLNLKNPKSNIQISDLIKLNSDWKNIGNDLRGAINEFDASSKTN